MRTVRVFYKKLGRLKFISHLDMNRFMLRALRLSGLPVWYTEGFNPHPYATFALPLSLGFESEYEAMDFRLTDDGCTNRDVERALGAVLPPELPLIRAADPVQKPGKITAARFSVYFETADAAALRERLGAFLNRPSIQVEKKGKKGKVSTLELAGKASAVFWREADGGLYLALTLPAGNDNVNPTLLLDAMEAEAPLPPYKVTRLSLLTADGTVFA